MKVKKEYILGIFVIFLYLSISFLLLLLPFEFPGFVLVVVSFYMGFGFDLNVGVARELMVFIFASCCVHFLMVIVIGIKDGWPGFKDYDSGTMLYCFLKLVLVLGFCVLSLGGLGDNISARNISLVSKTISELVGAFILGGWVWVANDFVGSIYVNCTRNV